jgi:plasmid replication DNA-binding protein KfrA
MTHQRLTEAEVHEACADIAAQGERPTSLTVLEKLGRGSLTTITKHMNTWHNSDDAQALKADELPAIVILPPELSKASEDLLKKVWQKAQDFAHAGVAIQRMALKEAERVNQAKVDEAIKFSEGQGIKVKNLEDALADIKKQLTVENSGHAETVARLNTVEKTNVALAKDNDQLKQDNNALKKKVAALVSENKTAQAELKTAHKVAVTAEKRAAKLEGQLEVYRSFDQKPKIKT